MNIAQRINEYFIQHHAATTFTDDKLTAEFAGDMTTLTTFMHEALDLALGKATPLKSAYYIDLVNNANTPYDWNYRPGQEVQWQQAERIYGMPVIIHHHTTAMRPQALPNPDNKNIANSAELILPHTGPVMNGYQKQSDGKGHLTIDLSLLETYLAPSYS